MQFDTLKFYVYNIFMQTNLLLQMRHKNSYKYASTHALKYSIVTSFARLDINYLQPLHCWYRFKLDSLLGWDRFDKRNLTVLDVC